MAQGIYRRPSTSKSIYGHKNAGRQAAKLFEELAESFNASGEVYIRRTLKTSKPGNTEREYPPVYEVWFTPNFWTTIGREQMEKLFVIGDKYECKVSFVAKDKYAVVSFQDGGIGFGGN